MTHLRMVLAISALLAASPAVLAGSEKDCLLTGTVHHDSQGGQDATRVSIHSISSYDDNSKCKVRRGEKMEFKLPQDTRVKEAPSGSAVKYRYQTDEAGDSNAELISIGT